MHTPHNDGRLRVLHVVGDSRFGGAANIIVGLGRIAKSEGWEVDVLATNPVFQKFARDHGMGIVDLDVIRRRIRPLWDAGGALRLKQFLCRNPYRIVHTHTSKGGFVGRLAARMAGVPVIVHTVHGFAFHEASPAPVRLFYSALERMAADWCDRIVSVSEFHRDWALRLRMCTADRIVAIPNGVADVAATPEFAANGLRRRLGAHEGDLLVLSLARLAPDKGLEYLVRAVAMLPPLDRRVLIAIAGDGPMHDDMQRLIARLGVVGRVKLLGFRSDVTALLAACDVVAIPSLREGLSIALLQAMAAGKAIIATTIGSQREVSTHGEIAHLVPPGDATALCEAITLMAQRPDLAARLGATARSVFEHRYTEERMLASYRQLYFDLLNAKCPAAQAAVGKSKGLVL